ncbi:MAG: hypothetical protein J6Q55_00490, partial [Clostridia bacterium]|nr:hypothetical protein [Clostridia bacterium]
MTTGVVAACTSPHTCQSVCADCNKCTNADCTESTCQQKCTCEAHVCQDKCHYCKGCKGDCQEPTCATKCQCAPVQVTHTNWDILVNKPTRTTVHQFVTNKPGPAIVIVGGTHGNETAGWN